MEHLRPHRGDGGHHLDPGHARDPRSVLAAADRIPDAGDARPGDGRGGARGAAGRTGEIIIAGPNVSPGYLNRPDLVEKAFFVLDGHRAYRTGDWGRSRDGMLFFEGRMDNQIKLHGHRIELADVEANLRALPGVRDAVVLPVLKQGAVDSLAAFVILNERPPRSDFQLAADLKAQLIERVPAYMIPRKFSFLESFR